MSFEDADALEKAVEAMIKVHDQGKELAAYAGDRHSYDRHADVSDALEQVRSMVHRVSGIYA